MLHWYDESHSDAMDFHTRITLRVRQAGINASTKINSNRYLQRLAWEDKTMGFWGSYYNAWLKDTDQFYTEVKIDTKSVPMIIIFCIFQRSPSQPDYIFSMTAWQNYGYLYHFSLVPGRSASGLVITLFLMILLDLPQGCLREMAFFLTGVLCHSI